MFIVQYKNEEREGREVIITNPVEGGDIKSISFREGKGYFIIRSDNLESQFSSGP